MIQEQFRLSAHSEWGCASTKRGIGFHNGPAGQEDDLKILKLGKERLLIMQFGFSEYPQPNPESCRVNNLEAVRTLALRKALMGTHINLQVQPSGLWSGGKGISKLKPQFSVLNLTIG